MWIKQTDIAQLKSRVRTKIGSQLVLLDDFWTAGGQMEALEQLLEKAEVIIYKHNRVNQKYEKTQQLEGLREIVKIAAVYQGEPEPPENLRYVFRVKPEK